jgi:hypothetical protein
MTRCLGAARRTSNEEGPSRHVCGAGSPGSHVASPDRTHAVSGTKEPLLIEGRRATTHDPALKETGDTDRGVRAMWRGASEGVNPHAQGRDS